MLNDANVLLVVAIVLLVGTISGALAKLLHLPSVTGQIIAGVLMGASVFGIVDDATLHLLDPLVDFALGLMAVAVGSHLNFRRLRVARRRLVMLLILEATLTPLFIFVPMMLFTGVQWSTALLMATIAISTAPATVLAVVKETASKGSFVTTLIAGVALNNLVCIILFEISRTIARSAIAPTEQVANNILVPLGNIAGSLSFGFLVGFVLVTATIRIVRTDRLSVLSLIAILLTVGLASQLQLSVLLACLCLGVTLANLSPDKEEIGHRVFDSFEPAVFAVFFIVAGMQLHLDTLAQGGLLAAMAFSGRMAGKVAAGYFGMTLAGATPRFRRWIGLALTPQAGLAVGLLLLVQKDSAFQAIHELIVAVVLAMVLMNEIVGPILTRISLKQSGDFGRDRARILDFLSEHNITTDLQGPDKATAIRELVDLTIQSNHLSISSDELFTKVMKGDSAAASCVGEGLAFPHARLDICDKIVGAMGINTKGLEFPTPDHRPVHCMVLIITPLSMPERHLQVLQALSASIGRDRNIQQQLYHIDSPAHADELLHLDIQFEDWNYYLDD